MAFADFGDCWTEFRRVSSQQEAFVNFIGKHGSELNLSKATSCLSIGAGAGEVDAYLIRTTMPSLKTYHGVEMDPANFRELETTMKAVSDRGVDTFLHETRAEDWEGAQEKVDVILLFEVWYFFENPKDFLKKCLSWLSPQGVILTTVWVDDNNIFLNEARPESLQADLPACSDVTVRRLLTELMEVMQVHEFESTLNLSRSTDTFVNFYLNRDATLKEVADFKTFIHDNFTSPDDGSMIVSYSVMLLVCRKKV